MSAEDFSNNLIKQMKMRNCQILWSTWGFTKITRLVVWRYTSSGRKFTAGTKPPNHTRERLNEELHKGSEAEY